MNIKNVSLILSLSFICLNLLSCSNADAFKREARADNAYATKNIKISDFKKIEIGQGIIVNFRQSANPGYAEVRANPEIIDLVEIKVDGDELEIGYSNKNNGLEIKGKTVVNVFSRNFSGAETSSAATLFIKGNLSVQNKVEIEASSASKVEIDNIVCPLLDIESSSASSVSVKSLKGNLEAEATSTSKISIDVALGKTMSLESSSAATIDMRGIRCDALKAEASSASSIILAGECNTLKKETSSAADVKHSKLLVKKK